MDTEPPTAPPTAKPASVFKGLATEMRWGRAAWGLCPAQGALARGVLRSPGLTATRMVSDVCV